MTKLVVEGIDRAGKSSFIQYIGEQLGWPITKMRVPKSPRDAVLFYKQYWDQLRDYPHSLVYDRGHISEAVYAPLYRPTSCNHFWPNAVYADELLVEDVFIVYVYPNAKHHDLLLPDERPNANRDAELMAFDVRLEMSSLPVIPICSHSKYGPFWRTHADMFQELMSGLTACTLSNRTWV